MGERQRVWAAKKTSELRVELGGVCKHCGTTEKLQFDCIAAQGHRHHKIEWSNRLSFYRQQHREGNLQLLCEKCNAKKSVGERPTEPEEEVEQPF